MLRGSQARVVVPSAEISPWIKHAIVAIEDKRFYEHRGVDLRGILRALWADITHGGAVAGRLDDHAAVRQERRTPASADDRRASCVEAALAWQLEQNWTKDQILTAYLNTIYFGNGAYGVEEACRDLLRAERRHARSNPAEAALLAGDPRGSEPLRPGRAPDAGPRGPPKPRAARDVPAGHT